MKFMTELWCDLHLKLIASIHYVPASRVEWRKWRVYFAKISPADDTLFSFDTFHFSGARHKSRNKMKIVFISAHKYGFVCESVSFYFDFVCGCGPKAGLTTVNLPLPLAKTLNAHSRKMLSFSDIFRPHLRRGPRKTRKPNQVGCEAKWKPAGPRKGRDAAELGAVALEWGQISGHCRLPMVQVVLHFKQMTAHYSSLCADGNFVYTHISSLHLYLKGEKIRKPFAKHF